MKRSFRTTYEDIRMIYGATSLNSPPNRYNVASLLTFYLFYYDFKWLQLNLSDS